MTTVASPVSVRDQAMAVIAARLGHPVSPKTEMDEIGGVVVADMLIDLEHRFDIGIDVDEVIPGTIEGLVNLTVRRAEGKGPRLYHWDDERLRRGLPYFAGRNTVLPFQPRPAVAPPPWPEILDVTPQTRTPCAVPSSEAIDAFGREERARGLILGSVFVCLPFALGLGGLWLHSLGVL